MEAAPRDRCPNSGALRPPSSPHCTLTPPMPRVRPSYTQTPCHHYISFSHGTQHQQPPSSTPYKASFSILTPRAGKSSSNGCPPTPIYEEMTLWILLPRWPSHRTASHRFLSLSPPLNASSPAPADQTGTTPSVTPSASPPWDSTAPIHRHNLG